jgi:hypothetical protein
MEPVINFQLRTDLTVVWLQAGCVPGGIRLDLSQTISDMIKVLRGFPQALHDGVRTVFARRPTLYSFNSRHFHHIRRY